MATYMVTGRKKEKGVNGNFRVNVESDEKALARYATSNEKYKHFEAIVKAQHFPLAEEIRIEGFNKV
jgi:hypothetical protein